MGREIDKTARFGHIVFPWLASSLSVFYVLAKGDLIGHYKKMTNDHMTCM